MDSHDSKVVKQRVRSGIFFFLPQNRIPQRIRLSTAGSCLALKGGNITQARSYPTANCWRICGWRLFTHMDSVLIHGKALLHPCCNPKPMFLCLQFNSVYPHIVKVYHKNTFKVGWTNTPTTSHQTCVRRPTVQMVAGCDWSHSTRHLGRWSSLVRKSGPATSKWNGDSSKHCDFTNKTCLFYKKDIVIFLIRSDDLTKKYDFAGNKGDVNNKMVSSPANNAFTNRITGNNHKMGSNGYFDKVSSSGSCAKLNKYQKVSPNTCFWGLEGENMVSPTNYQRYKWTSCQLTMSPFLNSNNLMISSYPAVGNRGEPIVAAVPASCNSLVISQTRLSTSWICWI